MAERVRYKLLDLEADMAAAAARVFGSLTARVQVLSPVDRAFSDPVTLGPNNELFLDQGSDCVDIGDDLAANTDYAAIGLDWTQLTTASDGTLDATPVDAGTHYPP